MKRFIIAKGSYKGLDKEEWEKYLNYHPDFSEIVESNDELSRLTKIVFAPGIDGNPTPDIAFYLSCGDDGFKEYMKNMLLKEHQGEVVSDDPDVAAQLVKSNLMTYKEYFKHIDDYVHAQMSGKE